MGRILRIGLWLVAWPIMLPIWLWRKGGVGKGLAVVFGVFFVMAAALMPGGDQDKEDTPTPMQAVVATFTPTVVVDVVAPTDTPMPVPTATPTEVPAATATDMPIIPVATATDVPLAPAATPTPEAAQPSANGDANLRAGPGTEYAIMGQAQAGQALEVVARNGAGDWYQLADGGWVAAFLVDGASGGLPIVEVAPAAVVQPTSAPVQAEQPAAPATNPQAFTCTGGCATPPDPSCAIKGNVNSKGERIYHVPGGQYYAQTDIKPEEGDRWFCTSAEARAAGFRASER